MSLYPIIRRKRRPLVDCVAAPVAVALKGPNEQVQEIEKSQGFPIAPIAPVPITPPVSKVGKARLSRENKSSPH